MTEYFKNEAAKMGIALSDQQLDKFNKYYETAVSCNKKFNLTAITAEKSFVEKHFLDSISAACLICPDALCIDIGSGAGFPAIPLKLVRDDLKFVLLDSLSKRVNFLTETTTSLSLSNMLALHARAEDAAAPKYRIPKDAFPTGFASFSQDTKTQLASGLREKFDVAVVRAVASLPVILEYTAAFLKLGGRLIAYKTDQSEVQSAQTAAETLGLAYSDTTHYTLPDGSRRALIVFEKHAPTPPKYPRGQNKPRTSPL